MSPQPMPQPAAVRPSRVTTATRRGITLLEILVVLGVIAILAVLTLPEFLKTMRRARLEGAAQTMTRLLLEARAEAIYRGCPVIVTPDRRDGRDFLVAWVDTDENGAFDGTIETDGTFTASTAGEFREVDYPLYEWVLPYRGNQVSDIYFWGADDTDPTSTTSTVEKLDEKPDGVDDEAMVEDDGYGDWEVGIVFLDNGSVAASGGIRIGMGAWGSGDRSVNFLELRIESKAGGRVELRKWIPDPHGAYEPKGFASTTYSQHGIAYEWEWF